jgi:hypothetical protein
MSKLIPSSFSEGRIYVVEKIDATGAKFERLVRASSQAAAIHAVVAGAFQAHAATGNEVAAFIHHKQVLNAMRQPADTGEDTNE